MIQQTLPAEVLSAERRRDVQKTLAATLLKWGAGGNVVRFAELAALAKAEHENA
jgi:hypothetical protein